METTPVGYYESLDFNNPMTSETADAIVAELAELDPQHVLDIGCGWAELLLRLLDICPVTTGHGIDHDKALIERAKGNASDRGIDSRVTFTESVDAVQATDLVLNVGAEHVFGDLDRALVELWKLVKPGGHLLLGTQFWEQPPTPDLIEAIGHVPTLPALVGSAVAVGWRPRNLRVATPRDWDHFEFGFLADWEQFVMAPTSDSGAERAAQAADDHRAEYFKRRGVLGFAFLTLGRPEPPPVD